MRLRRFIHLGLLLAMLAACSPKPVDYKLSMGFTAEGWPYRGNPNASVTIWEFFEFQ